MNRTATVSKPAVKQRVFHPPLDVCSREPRHAQSRIGKTYLGHQVFGMQIGLPELEGIVVVSEARAMNEPYE
jgi:hypothetical protein